MSTRLTSFFHTASEPGACYSGARHFPELRVYSPIPLDVVKLGLHFGRAAMRFVKVEGVSRGPTAFFRRASDSGACHFSARDCFGVARLFGNSPRSSEPLRFQSGRAVTRLVEVAGVSTRLIPLLRTCASQCTASHSNACHSGAVSFLGGVRLFPDSPGSSEAGT